MAGKKKTDKGSDIPSTIQRSGKKAQETWAKAHDSAVDSYGEGERAHRTAFSALKHTHEKIGDHWEPKEENGPSDEQAATGNRSSDKPTAGGVDANASKKHLQDVARRLEVKGRSKMDKKELVDAIQKANNRATAKARSVRALTARSTTMLMAATTLKNTPRWLTPRSHFTSRKVDR